MRGEDESGVGVDRKGKSRDGMGEITVDVDNGREKKILRMCILRGEGG